MPAEGRDQAKERARKASLETDQPVRLRFNDETLTYHRGRLMGPAGQEGQGEKMEAIPGESLDKAMLRAQEASRRSGGRVTLRFNRMLIVYDNGQLNSDQYRQV